MTSPQPPTANGLTYAQRQGWACCWCGTSLWTPAGGVSAGIARGRSGAHVLDIEVSACSLDCPKRPTPENDQPGGDQ